MPSLGYIARTVICAFETMTRTPFLTRVNSVAASSRWSCQEKISSLYRRNPLLSWLHRIRRIDAYDITRLNLN